MNEFDLEGAIAQWRERLSWREAFAESDLDEMEGHLREEVDALVKSGMTARKAYFEAVHGFGEDVKLSWRFNQANWEHVMVKRTVYAPIFIGNYFKVAIRNLLKNKVYSFVNIAGLAIGIACSVLIFLFVQDELRYDRFHEKADRIYRVGLKFTHEGREPMYHANTPGALGPILTSEMPNIEAVARISSYRVPLYVANDNARFYEDNVFWADPSVFEIFSFSFLKGDPQTALHDPYSMVMTEATARKYFGDRDPMGQVLTVRDTLSYTVTGILAPIPTQSHFNFDVLIHDPSMIVGNWGTFNYCTYILLKHTAIVNEADSQIHGMFTRFNPEIESRSNFTMRFFLQPLTDIYLHSRLLYEIGPTSNVATLTIFSSIAVFILLIACANFINLSTARAFGRMREVGMRKVVGAQRRQLIQQFLGESLLVTCIAFAIALFVIEMVLPFFNGLAQKNLVLNFDGNTISASFIILFCIGLGAGFYPAIVLSGFNPIEILKGKRHTVNDAAWLRKGLVVFQFSISIALLISTGIVNQQLHYMKDRNLGFQKDQMISVNWRWNPDIQRRYRSVKAALLEHPKVINILASHSIPGGVMPNMGFYAEGGERGHVDMLLVDHDFVKTYGLCVIEGRDFSEEFSTDESNAVLINESAVLDFGWKTPREALGKEFKMPEYGGKVIGVVKDFHFYGLQEPIKPLVIDIAPFMFVYFSIQVRGDNLSQTLADLSDMWSTQVPNRPFEYSFLDDEFDRQYRSEERMDRIFTVFSTLATLIGCLGLFSLVAFSVQQRTKEVGIRKVLGASTSSISVLLSKDFLKLVLVANIIAWPVSYYAMHQWLQDFAYRTAVSIDIFLYSGLVALSIALVTVGYHVFKAARANPVDSLRYE